MSTAIKYRLEAHSDKYRDVYRVDILEDGYTGAIIPKSIGADKLKLIKKDGVLQYTSLFISIQSDSNFEYIGFFQYNPRKFPVKLYKNDVQIWSGYIVNESYQEQYKNPPYDVELIATDGIGFLSNYKFENDGIQSRLDAVRYCLSNLNLNLSYSIAIDLFEQNMETNRSMLEQAYFYGEIFNGESCETVLKSLLPFGTILTQSNNKWLIRRPFEDAEKTHFIYDYEGNYTGTENGETVLSMGDVVNGGIWPHGMPFFSLEHAWKEVELVKDYGKRNSMLSNYDFSKGNFTDWSFVGTGDNEIRFLSDKYYAWLPGFALTNDIDENEEYITQSVQVEDALNTGGFVFSFKYCFIGGEYVDSTVYDFKQALSVYLKCYVVLDTSEPIGFQYFLTKDKGWVLVPPGGFEFPINNQIQLEVSTSQIITWSELKIITNNIPSPGTITIYLYKVPFNPINGRFVIKGSAFTDIEMYTLNRDEYSDKEESIIQIRENAPEINTITLKPVDLPDINNSPLLFWNGNYVLIDSVYEMSRLWSNNSTDELSIENVIKNQLLSYYGQPRQKLSSVNWRGEGLHLNCISKHSLNSNRIFISDFGEWNILDDTWSITWKEKPDSADNSNWILDTGYWDDNGVWIDTENWEDTDVNLIVVNLSDPAPDGIFDITSETGIANGDTINSLPSVLLFGDKLYQDATQISLVPHNFTGTNLYFYMSLTHSESYQTSFTATIGGVEKTIQIIVTL